MLRTGQPFRLGDRVPVMTQFITDSVQCDANTEAIENGLSEMKAGLKQRPLARGPGLNGRLPEKKGIKGSPFLLGLQNFRFMNSRAD